MKYLAIALILNILVIGSGVYLFLQKNAGNTAFIYNQKVFEGFKGTQDLKKKLKEVQLRDRRILDSLVILIGQGRSDMEQIHQKKQQESELHQQQLSDQYTADVWKRINTYVADYGKNQGFDFIYGASGDGSLMYARESLDITNPVIDYCNQRYESGD